MPNFAFGLEGTGWYAIATGWPSCIERDARRWNQGQENLNDKSCLDSEIHFTAILETCADADPLYKPRIQD